MAKENLRSNEKRVSRGYRLRSSTHDLIKSLQELTRADSDEIITKSCLLLHKQIIEEKEQKLKH
ncbi:MAG: hypothetical protein IAE90_00535 [Ignavibacteria bacterium]|nr:hypothetical protein [Ignavibacteria bacterium]